MVLNLWSEGMDMLRTTGCVEVEEEEDTFRNANKERSNPTASAEASAQGRKRRQAGVCTWTAVCRRGAVGSWAPERTSSITMRASPMACKRWRGSFCKQ